MQDLQDYPRNPSFRDQGSPCSPVGPCLWALLFSRAWGTAGFSLARPSGLGQPPFSSPTPNQEPLSPGWESTQPYQQGALAGLGLCLCVGWRRVPSAFSHHLQTATPRKELECFHRETQMPSLSINPNEEGSDLVQGNNQRKGNPTGPMEKYCWRVGPGPHVEGAEP